MHEEIAGEKIYCSIFVERFYYLLFYVVGAEPGANEPRPLDCNMDHDAADDAGVVPRRARWHAAAGNTWSADASAFPTGGAVRFPRRIPVPAAEKRTSFH